MSWNQRNTAENIMEIKKAFCLLNDDLQKKVVDYAVKLSQENKYEVFITKDGQILEYRGGKRI